MISSFVYRRVLDGNRITKKLWGMIRRLRISMGRETQCTMRVHGRDLVMPLSHVLPLYLQGLPFYDRLPGRLAKFIKAHFNSVRCIDVGANIGDTIAALKEPICTETNALADIFLAIEPNPRFRKYLHSNWGNDQSVIILPYACSSSDGATTACISELNGTASINLNNDVGDNQCRLEMMTIDSIVQKHNICGNFNLLKIDTDGHDFEVLAGAKSFLKKAQPFLYFEVDAFSNPKFVQDCIDTVEHLGAVGYKKLFVYDNLGHFMGLFGTADTLNIRNLLLYKLAKGSFYYDFLLMKDQFVDEFYKLEVEYFLSKVNDPKLPYAV